MNQRTLFLVLAFMPCVAFASDPTGLFIIMIELPILLFSIPLAFLYKAAAKLGAVLNIAYLTLEFFVLFWASGVGYMYDAGYFLISAIVVTLIGLVVCSGRIADERPSKAPNYNWVCPKCSTTNPAGTLKCDVEGCTYEV